MSEKELIYADDLYDKVSSMGLQNGSALGHHSGTADVIAEMIQNAPAVDPASCLNWRTGKPPEHESWFAKFKDTEQWRFGMFETMSDEVLVTVEFPGGERYTTTAHTTDGEWVPSYESIEGRIIAWTEMPAPAKEAAKMRTLNADQLKAVLSMESSLGHIHTLADVENTIDYLAKEEPEAVAGVEKFNIFDTPWAGKIQAAFPQSLVNMQNELIFSLRTDSGFSLKDVTDETQLKAKFLEWLTRTAIKAVSPKERKLHFEGINKLLGTNFTLEEMTDIYTYLGNGINHDLCVKFVESGYDMTMIQKEG